MPPLKTEGCCGGVCDFRYARDTRSPRHPGASRRNRSGLGRAFAAVWDGTVLTVTQFNWLAGDVAEANQVLTDLFLPLGQGLGRR